MIGLTLEEIDRAIYNHLRIGLVTYECLPDISQYSTDESYQTARAVIKGKEKDYGTPLVDIYGIGTGETREATDENKIVIDRNGIGSGSIGGNYTKRFEKVENKWSKKQNPDGSINLDYEVRTLTNKTSYDRLLTSLIFSILGTSRYIPVFLNYTTQTDKLFFLSYEGSVNVSSTIDTIERLHRFTVVDVFLQQPDILAGTGTLGDFLIRKDIVPLTSIHFKVNLYDSGVDEGLETIVE